jgi:multidrug efflux pump subunit AcrA (membrane-fusion protein)
LQAAIDAASREGRTLSIAELGKLGVLALPPEGADLDTLLKKLPAVVRADNLVKNSASRLARGRTLRGTNAISVEEYEQLETESSVAESNLQQAIVDAKATLAAARLKYSQYVTAQQHLADTRVEVPAPKIARDPKEEKVQYVIDKRMVEVGEMVMASPIMSTGVYHIVRDDVLKLRATVPERYVGEVKTDQTVQVSVEAYPGKTFEGKIRWISPTVDPKNRTFEIEALVPNPQRELKPGGFARVAILISVDKAAPTVPIEALESFAGINKIFIARKGNKTELEAHAIEVVSGVSDRSTKDDVTWLEVRGKNERLPPDAQVVTSGQTQLAEGTAVKIRQKPEKTGKDPKTTDSPQP